MIIKEKVKKIIKKCLMDKFDGKIHVYDFPELNVALQDAVDEYETWTDADFAPGHEKPILLSFANANYPAIGWCKKYLDGRVNYMLLTNETCLENGLIVNAWMELPKCFKERESR